VFKIKGDVMTHNCEDELSRCKMMVLRQLDVMTLILKNLKEVNKLAKLGADTSDLERSIVGLQEQVETCVELEEGVWAVMEDHKI